jgi:hypothetical protein
MNNKLLKFGKDARRLMKLDTGTPALDDTFSCGIAARVLDLASVN